ncbi:hypothetical protein KP509_17G051400 [Ceratopteris richardii]|nr:hypothetical protein KP509_17G051400 [Ceratopteris richardii]
MKDDLANGPAPKVIEREKSSGSDVDDDSNSNVDSSPQKQSLLFSATLPDWVRKLAGKYLRNHIIVDLDVHYDVANNTETFVHCSGRTGRAGKQGTAILMYVEQQCRTLDSLQRELGCRFEDISAPW